MWEVEDCILLHCASFGSSTVAMAGSACFLLFVGLVVGVQSEISNQSAVLEAVNASVRAGGQPLVVGPSRQLMLRFVQGTHTRYHEKIEARCATILMCVCVGKDIINNGVGGPRSSPTTCTGGACRMNMGIVRNSKMAKGSSNCMPEYSRTVRLT